MNTIHRAPRWFVRIAAAAVVFAAAAATSQAQHTTTSTIKHGESSYDTTVTNSEVVYVEGNDLVIRGEDGRLEHLTVPDSDVFVIDGKNASVHELTPGTLLTQTITTTTVPRYVNTVQVLKGKIWHLSPHASTVILKLPDGKTKFYTIPKNATFMINGQKKTVHDLKKGMTLEATIITDDTHSIGEKTKLITGQAPPPAIATPREVGILLFVEPVIRTLSAQDNDAVASVEESQPEPQLAASLPSTGSLIPVAGLLGGLSFAASFGLAAVRKAVKI